MPPRFRTVLFDLDGTLIDSVRLILDSYHHTTRTHGLPPRTDAEWLAGLGTPLRVQFGHWDDGRGMLEALIATYREYNLANHDAMIRLYDGVDTMLAAVRAAGCRTALVTSKNRAGAERGLRLFGLDAHIETIVGADDVERPKPHPEPVHLALARLGGAPDPDATLFVGDSTHDMHAGRAAGVRTAAVLWGPFARAELEPTAPDFWAERPAEIVRLVRGS